MQGIHSRPDEPGKGVVRSGRWIGRVALMAAVAPLWGCASWSPALREDRASGRRWYGPGRSGLVGVSPIPRWFQHLSAGWETPIPWSGWRPTRSCGNGPEKISATSLGRLPRNDQRGRPLANMVEGGARRCSCDSIATVDALGALAGNGATGQFQSGPQPMSPGDAYGPLPAR